MTTVRTLIACTILATSGTPLIAQDVGRGSLGPNGREPILELQPVAPNSTVRFRVSDLTPPASSGMQLLLLVGALATEVPLDAIGVRGAVLGVDLNTAIWIGPLPVDSQGRSELSVAMQPAWDGATVHAQAIAFEPRVASSYVLSDSRSMTLGAAEGTIPMLADDAAGGLTFAQRLADGRPGPAAQRDRLTLLELELASLDEERRFRRDMPRPIRILGKRAVQLGDRSTLLRVRDSRRARQTIYRAHRDGRLEVVVETTTGFDNMAAASPTHAAFVEQPSGRLLLYRLDGSNWPNSAEPVIDATPQGVALEASALCFGTRKLCYLDKTRGPFLIDLRTGKPSAVRLPPSGGRVPLFHDEEVAVSADGLSFAFGAGPDKKAKDVYVLRDTGVGINVTKRVSDYAEVGYSNRGRRTEIVLDAGGLRVAYVDEGGKEPENYITTIATSATVHMTGLTTFVDSIDIGSTVRMPKNGGAMMIAGMDESSLDVFFSASASARDVVSLTKTGSATTPPWGRDARLDILDLASLATQPQFLVHAKHQSRTHAELWVVDAARRTARIAARNFTGMAGIDVNATRVWIADGAQVVVVDPADTTSAFAKRLTLGAATGVAALTADASARTAYVTTNLGTQRELWSVDFRGSANRIATIPDLDPNLYSHTPATLHLLSAPGAQGRRLLRWRHSDGLKDVGGSRLRAFLLRS